MHIKLNQTTFKLFSVNDLLTIHARWEHGVKVDALRVSEKLNNYVKHVIWTYYMNIWYGDPQT